MVGKEEERRKGDLTTGLGYSTGMNQSTVSMESIYYCFTSLGLVLLQNPPPSLTTNVPSS